MIVERFGLSERRACQITGQHRSTQRHQPGDDADRNDALRERLRRLSAEHPRWGYRLAWGAVRAEGWAVNRKKIQRLWREEGLPVPQRKRKRQRLGDSTVPAKRLPGRAPQPCLGLGLPVRHHQRRPHAETAHSGGWTDKRSPSPGSLLYQPTTEGAARPARDAVRPAARQTVTGKEGHHDSHINHHRGGRHTMNAPTSITITPVFVADLSVEGERMPVYVHVIDHPDARVLVDTGMTELHPAMADMDPRLQPLSEQDFDLAGIDIVVNTHLHADHCGGNHLFAGKPIYVQRRELDDARSKDDYTIREWVEAPGVQYVPVDGEHELLPGLRLVPAPGHTPGMQMVVVETGGRPVIVGGDVAVWFGEFDEPPTEGRQRVLALDPELVWLTHEREPWRPPTV